MAQISPVTRHTIDQFIDFCVDKLGIDRPVTVELLDEDQAVDEPDSHTTGVYSQDEASIKVAVRGRKLADVLRTLGHELAHHRQYEIGTLRDGEGHNQPAEDEANAMSGRLVKKFGDVNPEVYQLKT